MTFCEVAMAVAQVIPKKRKNADERLRVIFSMTVWGRIVNKDRQTNTCVI
jgi:hypothetical protein